jgi:hypothetical protein
MAWIGGALAGALSAAATDSTCWLVLRGGGTIAARCPYEVRGERLLFHGLDGVWAALPLALVDVEATAAARSHPSPRAARTVTLPAPPAPPPVSPVGRAGEAAKRAGHKGAFIDLSKVMAPEPEAVPAAPRSEGSAPALVVVDAPSAERRPALDKPDRLLRLRVKRGAKPR